MSTLHWQKSTYSGDGSNCVEIAATAAAIHIRDSKAPDVPNATCAPPAWKDFICHIAPPGTARFFIALSGRDGRVG